MSKKITTAILPVAGSGTRFLPFTKVVPKEMLPIGTKPLIQHCVEEAIASGITHIVFVISKGKELIAQHFCPHRALEGKVKDKQDLSESLHELNNMHTKCQFSFVYQHDPKGLGDAITYAKTHLKQDEYFAVILPDDYMYTTGKPCLAQMMEKFYRQQGNYIIAEKIPPSASDKYGIFDLQGSDPQGKSSFKVAGVVEKPQP